MRILFTFALKIYKLFLFEDPEGFYIVMVAERRYSIIDFSCKIRNANNLRVLKFCRADIQKLENSPEEYLFSWYHFLNCEEEKNNTT